MADNNVLRIKVGVAFNPTEIAKEANKAFKESEALLKKFNASIKGSNAGEIAQDKITTATTKANKELKKQESIWALMTKNINSTIANFLKFTIVSSIFMALTVTIRSMLSLMFELDEAYTNLKIVSGATAEEMENIDERVSKLSISLGRLKKEVVDATTEFLRAGYGIDESMTLAENAIKGANVGAVDLADVTTYLIAGLRAFNFEAGESARILDVLFSVSNATAIDLEGIGEAFLRSANTLKAAGATLEEASALIAGANESIQDPSKVGTALKTIATRLRGVSEDGEIVPTLEKDFKNLGIEIRNSEGGFRNIYDIFKELSVAIKSVDDLTKQSILEKLAGKRQVNILQGLLNDFDIVEMSLEEGLTSFGQVSKAQEIQVQSLEGKMNILKESVGQLLTAMSDSEGFKIFLDGITFVVVALTNLVKVISAIPNSIKILGGLGVVLGVLTQSIYLFVGSMGTALVITQPWLLAIGAGVAVLSAFSLAGQESKKSQEELNAELEKSTKLQGEFSKKFLQSSEEDQKKIAQSINETINALKKLREEQAKSPQRSSKLSEEFGQDVKFEETENKIKDLTQSLLDLGFSEKDASRWMEEYGNSALVAKTKTEILRNRIQDTNVQIKKSVEDTQLLVDAKYQLEEAGAIELETLDKLLLEHPEYADALGLTKDAQLLLFDTMIKTSKTGLENSIFTLEQEKKVALAKIELLNNQAKAHLSLARIIGIATFTGNAIPEAFLAGQERVISNLELEIENIETQQNLLKNGIAISKNVVSNAEESRKKEEDKTKSLTAQERALSDINYQIELQQKLISQLEGAEREKAQLNLISLYEKQKLAIMAVRDSLNKAELGTDAYNQEVKNLSLSIEDANLAMYNLKKEMFESDTNIQLKALDDLKALTESQKQNLEDLRNTIEEYIKFGIEQQIEAQEKLLELAKDELDSKLKLIDAENELKNFAKDRAELELSIAKDTDAINKLKTAALQGDTKAQAKLLDLQKTRSESQQALDELINERAVESTKERLTEEYDLYEKSVNKRISTLQEELNDAGNITKLANDRLKSYLSDSSDSLYQDLITWNSKYGTGMDVDVISKWEKAIGLVKQFNATLSGSGGFTFEGAQASLDSVSKNAVIEKMRKNSQLWNLATTAEEKKRLNDANKRLAETIGYAFNASDGRYYPSDPTKDRIPLYDNGGLKPKGEMGILGESVKEWIFDDNQLKAIQKMAIGEFVKNPDVSNVSSPTINVVIEGSISNENLGKITNDIKDVVTQVSQGQLDSFRSRGIKVSTSTR